MTHYTLGISSSNHDSSICLLGDNNVLAMWPCERTSRNKHTQKVTRHDLSIIKQYTDYVDNIILVNVYDPNIKQTPLNTEGRFVELENTNTLPSPVASNVSESITNLRQMLHNTGIRWGRIAIDNARHHLYHAAAGFYTSGFDSALCIVIDGLGSSWAWKNAILGETTSIFYASDNIVPVYKQLFYKPRNLIGWNQKYISKVKEIFNHPTDICPHLDIGKMYGTTTRHIGLGSSMDAGKTMGLSAYGKPNNLPSMLIGDSIISDLNLFRNDSQINTFLYPNLINMSDQDKKNFAYNIQRATEKIFIKRVEQALQLKKCSNLILGGGCALNILANSKIKQTFPHLNIYVEPIAADSSQSLGAALFHHKRNFPKVKFNKTNGLFFGPEYSIVDIKTKLLKLVEQHNNESSLQIISN